MDAAQFKLNYKSLSPFAEQLASFIREQIQAGSLSAGDQLPTMREAATLFHLGVATINKAYQILIEESVLESRGRQGVFVSDTPQHMTGDETMNQEIRELLRPIVDYCRQNNIPLETVAALLRDSF